MTPAQIITPFLEEADRRKPHLKNDNTGASCMELLEDTAKLAGPDWYFIGKTDNMDGSGVRPAWFSPVTIDAIRPDGQHQKILITRLGMDALWHLPTGTQVKVIVNSTANDDPRPDIHGPARLTPYMIDQKDYRWHNPPIPQRAGPQPVPMPGPNIPGRFPYPDEGTLVKALQDRVKAAYKAVGRAFPDPNDSDAYRHFARFGYDCHEMDAQAAADKRIRELRAELGAPPE